MGPFLGTFLRENHHWDAGRVGIALAASQIGTVLAQTPAGALIDRIRWKRLAVAHRGGGGRRGLRRALSGADARGGRRRADGDRGGGGDLPAGRRGPDVWAWSAGRPWHARTGRNEAFNHGGNVVAAALAGGLAYLLGYGAMFFLVAGMAAASAVAVLLIREADIDHDLARGADDGEAEGVARPSASPSCSRTAGSRSSPPRSSCSISPTRRCCRWSARSRATA